MPRPLTVLSFAVVALCLTPRLDAAVPGTPAPPGPNTTTTSVQALSMNLWVSCANGAGEYVQLSGELRTSITTVVDGQGGTHYRALVQPDGVRGVGQTTGLRYHGTGGTVVSEFAAADGYPYTRTIVNNFRIIGQGPGNNLLVHSTLHVTVNANGDMTSSVNMASTECM